MKLEELVRFVDYTTLNSSDTKEDILHLINNAKSLLSRGYKVAGICSYSNYSSLLIEELENTKIASVVVAAGFPHSQCPTEIKIQSVKHSNNLGVDEIDIVIPLHYLLSEEYDKVSQELSLIRSAIDKALLKVIIETGLIDSEEMIRRACRIVLDSGADFIKTSTGKVSEGATAKKFKIICEEIQKFELETGKKIGVKAAGGIRTVEDANAFVHIVQNTLGDDYLDPKYFRIGASSLLKELI